MILWCYWYGFITYLRVFLSYKDIFYYFWGLFPFLFLYWPLSWARSSQRWSCLVYGLTLLVWGQSLGGQFVQVNDSIKPFYLETDSCSITSLDGLHILPDKLLPKCRIHTMNANLFYLVQKTFHLLNQTWVPRRRLFTLDTFPLS